jgi:hypothetical protein
MVDKTWKAAERKIASILKGVRRGADFTGEKGGKCDVYKPGWSIEVKHGKRHTYGMICSAVDQAEDAADKSDIPIAVIHKTGTKYEDSLVVMRLSTFADLFVNETVE